MPDADAGGLTSGELRRLRETLRRRRFSEATTDDLARAAGLSRMTLHRRGADRHTILRGLGELMEAEHREAVLPALSDAGDGRQRLRIALEGLCDVNERYLALLDALAEDAGSVFHEPGAGELLTRSSFTGALVRILQDGARDGSLKSEDPEQTATLLFNAVGWTYRHMRLGHRWPPARARRNIVDLLMDGLAADG